MASAQRVRAVSNVVATLLLVSIAVVGGIVVWMYMTQYAHPRSIASLSIASATAVIPPDGSDMSVNLMVKNDGNVPLNITVISFTYAGKIYNITENRLLSAGASTTLGFDLKPGDFGVTAFVEGKTLKITVYYRDPQGNQYSKTAYATITMG